YARRLTRQDLIFAIQMFEQAIILDPDFALAHASIARACGLFYEWHEKDATWLEKGLAACERALALDPQLPEALTARAGIYVAQGKYDPASQLARRAIERRPDCEGAYWTLGRAYFASDHFQEAADVAARAIEVSGDDYNVFVPYVMALERLGQRDVASGLRDQMTRVMERQIATVPDDVRARILLAGNYAFVGDEVSAIRELQKAVALRPNDANVLYNAACTYGVLQRKSDALAMLKKAKEVGYRYFDWIARDPDLACLHDDPEFEQLIKGGEQESTPSA
ncbi:MAG TPA: tetratricopeptide repeat protein, partial [Terriglobia bacterium]|nr:tetratricopeptide repeat protein [Terriglobia bacterium]